MSDTKIIPCPVCGEQGNLRFRPVECEVGKITMVDVVCQGCGCSSAPVILYGEPKPSAMKKVKYAAIKTWDSRRFVIRRKKVK